MPNRLFAYSSSVIVPGKGWHLFGGYESTLSNAQRLQTLNGNWDQGLPSIYQIDYIQCAVQVKLAFYSLVVFISMKSVARHLFGGYENSLSIAQRIQNLNGNWKQRLPIIYQIDYIQCAVHVELLVYRKKKVSMSH
jgi:hypothetical protein